MRLKRACLANDSALEQIVSAVLDELENSCGSFAGYRQLTRRLRRNYNLLVRRDTITDEMSSRHTSTSLQVVVVLLKVKAV